ncbi:MAG: lipoate--protein ligase [Bacteroidales bacterium]|jgi:lipoate-protein ligase A
MRCLIDNTTDPYWNLAVEEYLLTRLQVPVFRLWRNAPAIIVGRNQHTRSEINSEYVRENNIAVVRRLSGGGAVFHDLGNINYTFADRYPPGTDTSEIFARFTRPILDVLHTLGVNACLEGRNDLVIDGRKFSGNAIALHKNRILMHGTLLFSASMKDLSLALKPKVREKTRGVPSNPRAVCNISEYLQQKMDAAGFLDILKKHIAGNPGKTYKDEPLSEQEHKIIRELCDCKYRTDSWNYGKDTAYSTARKKRFAGGNMEVLLNVRNGLIEEAKIYGDYFFLSPTRDIEDALAGCPHREESIRKRFKNFRMEDYFRNIPPEDLIELLL